jgi:hypothetical protein
MANEVRARVMTVREERAPPLRTRRVTGCIGRQLTLYGTACPRNGPEPNATRPRATPRSPDVGAVGREQEALESPSSTRSSEQNALPSVPVDSEKERAADFQDDRLPGSPRNQTIPREADREH